MTAKLKKRGGIRRHSESQQPADTVDKSRPLRGSTHNVAQLFFAGGGVPPPTPKEGVTNECPTRPDDDLLKWVVPRVLVLAVGKEAGNESALPATRLRLES